MRLRTPLIVLAAVAAFVAGALPALAESDMVDRYNRLVATGGRHLHARGRHEGE